MLVRRFFTPNPPNLAGAMLFDSELEPGEDEALRVYFGANRHARNVPREDRDGFQRYHSTKLGAFYSLSGADDETPSA